MTANRFRPVFRELSHDEGALSDEIKDKAEELAQLFDKVGGRYGAIANTKLEEAVMFAVNGVTS